MKNRSSPRRLSTAGVGILTTLTLCRNPPDQEMPSKPDIEKGEGFVRSLDLLEELSSDISTAYEQLENQRDSQYLRRCVVWATYSFIEAMLECVKVELRSSVRREPTLRASMTEKETEIIGGFGLLNANARFMPLDEDCKRTFKLAAKLWQLQAFQLATSGEPYRCFLASKDARNRLAHPKTYYDIQVTESDMHHHAVAGAWAKSEFRRLLQARFHAYLETLSDEDAEVFKQVRARKM